jgi:hypothetical protein
MVVMASSLATRRDDEQGNTTRQNSKVKQKQQS